MPSEAQSFYSTPARPPFAREDVLAGRVVRINPALITLTDGLAGKSSPEALQARVRAQVETLLRHGVRTFHVDVNFPDYGGFDERGPETNIAVFTPEFLQSLQRLLQPADAFMDLHLLTDYPLEHLRDYARAAPGAVSFQLDAVDQSPRLIALMTRIQAIGACPSAVVETVGTARRPALPSAAVRARLAPVLADIGMLTFQAAPTAARSGLAARALNSPAVRSYLAPLRARFAGTVQLQGGITTHTVAEAVRLGADFLVCGTELFRSAEPGAAENVIDAMLAAAAGVLV